MVFFLIIVVEGNFINDYMLNGSLVLYFFILIYIWYGVVCSM